MISEICDQSKSILVVSVQPKNASMFRQKIFGLGFRGLGLGYCLPFSSRLEPQNITSHSILGSSSCPSFPCSTSSVASLALWSSAYNEPSPPQCSASQSSGFVLQPRFARSGPLVASYQQNWSVRA